MSHIRCIYRGAAPAFPACDQHPDAKRYGPIQIAEGAVVFADAIGGQPTIEEIAAVLDQAPRAELTPAQKLAAAGLTVADLKALLDLA